VREREREEEGGKERGRREREGGRLLFLPSSKRPLVYTNTDTRPSFLGLQKDEGYDVLLARLRGASRTVDEVRGFWKER